MGHARSTEKNGETTIRLSVVSHGQDGLVKRLLASMADHCRCDRLRITVTRNVPDRKERIGRGDFPFPVTIVHNARPRGFGDNHNRALSSCPEEYYCVLNPDIVFHSDIFDQLLVCFRDPGVGVVAPALIDSDGKIQDSARLFPTPVRILRRIVSRRHEYCLAAQGGGAMLYPDWVAGMFMLFPAHIFRLIGGFDEAYYLYCEDADICMRLRRAGLATLLRSDVSAVHDARRSSHGSVRYLAWHLASLLRFFFKYPCYRL